MSPRAHTASRRVPAPLCRVRVFARLILMRKRGLVPPLPLLPALASLLQPFRGSVRVRRTSASPASARGRIPSRQARPVLARAPARAMSTRCRMARAPHAPCATAVGRAYHLVPRRSMCVRTTALALPPPPPPLRTRSSTNSIWRRDARPSPRSAGSGTCTRCRRSTGATSHVTTSIWAPYPPDPWTR